MAQQTGRDFCAWYPDSPLLPAPTLIGDWSDRAVTSNEVCKWITAVLSQCVDFDSSGFTAHGCKATTLSMLSRYGASSDDRLILGHHQLNKGAVEVYSRDLQSAPLRVLEQMFTDIRCGRFSPDVTRSGYFAQGIVARDESVAPSPTSPLDDASWSHVEESAPAVEVVSGPSSKTQHEVDADLLSDDSDTESETGESDEEAIIQELANSEKPSQDWHPGLQLWQHSTSKLVHALGNSGHREAFVCGRSLTKEYVPFTSQFFVDAMKCQQRNKGNRGSRMPRTLPKPQPLLNEPESAD